MTDNERKALIARLRDGRWKGETTCGPAADQIEADGKRIALLKRRVDQLKSILDTVSDQLRTAREALGDKT